MNRRRFLFLLSASAAAAAMPGKVFSFPTNIVIAELGDYADYVNYSDMFYGQGISPLIEKMSRELAQRLSLSLEIYLQNFEDAGVRTATGIMLAK